MDISFFNHNAFSMVTMMKAIENYAFKPDLIGSLNLFEEVETNKTTVGIERRDNKLSLIPTSKRGAPLIEADRDSRNVRFFPTIRIAKSDTIKAEEIQDRREFGTEDQLETAMKFIAKRQKNLIGEIELTWENMQLGAIQGIVLDADGSVLYDWYKEWGITPPEPIDFKLNEDTTDVSYMVNQIRIKMVKASGNTFSTRSRIIGFCGDEFFFKLKNHKTIRETYLNTSLAQTLNSTAGIATPGAIELGSFGSFDFAGATFVNYCNIHDYNMNTKSKTKRSIGIKPDECQFVPVNVPGVFQKTFAPGESWKVVNTVGKPLYPTLVIDRDNDAWVRAEVYSYPLFICARPEMLFKATVKAQ
ncbi:major capsid protein [Bartonella sp. WD12.1]|uniref:major capsid protein n=1 Tax=Bartonella sp. WD12.1 TaxID=1933903 RepID=UPI00099A3029|nr:major capsid protein [Bartonella sp. WD12.1]OPB29835.1 Phage major capsid protein E [Bartonella sp. WD12.1]OPB30045.1 Phage major capsid protein E [Bartonella sp. WD12.1]